MKTLALIALAVCVGCGAHRSPASAGAGESMPPAASPPPLSGSVTVHVVGDSTAAVFPPSDPTQRVGWAAALQPLFAKGVRVDDSARSGRSSKSFIDEGLWAALKANIRPGDYVLIQFGHNDEKVADRSRYTDPALSFREYLKVYIRDTRLAGGFAVLLTPISRREFAGNSIAATHGAYPAAILAVGRETGTPVIDMTDKTRALLEKLGPDETVPLFAVDDKTHLSARGAPEVASLVAEGLRELRLPLAARLAH